MDGFEKTSFNGAFDVYQRGRGPGVLLLPELPGITPPVTALATRIAGEGFTVAIPHLFGPIAPFSNLGAAKTFLQLCVRKEFALLASHRASPITDTLRALSKQLHERCGGRGVGAIGLCMTGNFALTLMLDPWVLAPVVAHPGLPVPIGKRRKAGVHAAPETLAVIRERGAEVLGLRFTHDPLCPRERFSTLAAAFGDAFEVIEIDSGPQNTHGFTTKSHSVLGRDRVDTPGHPTAAATERVLAFLRAKLR